ncbi:MAG: hypothetical protein NC312_08475 [Bacteroides fragilis]|nr:hypothetical protein [Bacteroides fragilis]
MSKTRLFHLKYPGRDSWERPVYEDDNGVLQKCSRASLKPAVCYKFIAPFLMMVFAAKLSGFMVKVENIRFRGYNV